MKLEQTTRAARLLTLASCLLMLTGCVATGSKSNDTSKRIYFSHSIDQSIKPDLFKQLPTSEPIVEGDPINAPEVVLHFDNDSAVVRSEDIERLQSFLLSFNEKQMPVFLITGHTDSNHSDQYNIGLSDRRAKATQAQMLRMGVPITQTALRGLGESTPIASNNSNDGRQSNRRVSVKAMKSTEAISKEPTTSNQ